MTTAPLRNTGIGFVGEVPWGTHVCHFFETHDDLLDVQTSFVKAGLDANEFCLWLVEDPQTEEGAKGALARVVPALDDHLERSSLEIHSARAWYTETGVLNLAGLFGVWEEKLAGALRRRFAGLRVNGSQAWLQEPDWRQFSEYEETFDRWMAGRPMIVLCSYPLATSDAGRILDVARTHGVAVAKRAGIWDVVERPEYRGAKAEIQRLNEELQQRVRERTAQLEVANRELLTRNRQQAAVAHLGQAAIHGQDLQALMDEAAAMAAATLGTDLAAVLELLEEDDAFRFRSGVGWKARVVGSSVKGNAPGLQILWADEAIAIPDVRANARFDEAHVLRQHGVVSVLGVNIRGRTRPWGGLMVCSTTAHTFSADDIDFLQSVANVAALAIERHDLEVAQRREKEILQAIFDNSPVMMSFYDASGRLLFANREWQRTLGWTLEEAQVVDVLAHANPDRERLSEAGEFVARAEGRWREFRTRTRDGKIIDTQWMPISLSDGSRIGFGLDITEGKRAENALRRAEELFRAVVEDQTEMIVRWKPDGTRTFVNKAYCRTFGKPFEELVGTSFWPLVAGPYRQQVRERIRNLTPDSPYSRGVHESLLPDGTTQWQEWSDRALFDELGRPVELQSVGRDITERKRAEEETRASAARLESLSRRLLTAQEEERRRLAVELHDELGQVLTAVKINLASLARQSGPSPPPEHLREALASVDRAMERVRDLALDLRPSVLDDLGLPAALRWYADRFARTTRIETHLSVDAVPRLAPALETACFRVAQEALTNVARHAQARHVWVDLHVLGDTLELTVRDDGIGFEAGLARERAIRGASMGLLGMQERVSLAGGQYELSTRPQGGTEVRARFPLGQRTGGVR